MAGTYVDEDRVIWAARLLGEMHCTQIGTNEIDLHSTHEVADVHGFDLLGCWCIARISNENVYWSDVIGDLLEYGFQHRKLLKHLW